MRSFLYLHCGDLDAMRRFYSEGIGLEEIFHSESDGVVGYRIGTLQLTIARHAHPVRTAGRARQLGWPEGDGSAPSWGIELSSDTYGRAVGSLIELGAVRFGDAPRWLGYWSFPVCDPMGNTIEVTCTDRAAWSSEP